MNKILPTLHCFSKQTHTFRSMMKLHHDGWMQSFVICKTPSTIVHNISLNCVSHSDPVMFISDTWSDMSRQAHWVKDQHKLFQLTIGSPFSYNFCFKVGVCDSGDRLLIFELWTQSNDIPPVPWPWSVDWLEWFKAWPESLYVFAIYRARTVYEHKTFFLGRRQNG